MDDREQPSVTELLSSFSQEIVKLRTEAIQARAASGIEQIWQEDEEYYDEIDEFNRADATWHKPRSAASSPTRDVKATEGRSTVFIGITRPYVDAAVARVADMLLPTDDRNWAIEPTPVPDLVALMDDATPVSDDAGNVMTRPVVDQDGAPVMGPAIADGQAILGPDGQPMMQPQSEPVRAKDVVAEMMAAARKKSDRAQSRIDDWHSEGQFNAEIRTVIEDAAKIGTGVLKGPFPARKRGRAILRTAEGFAVMMKEEVIPKSKRISAWNLFPDPACGENIHAGAYVFEYDQMNGRQLLELRGLPGYLDEEIDAAFEEGPKSSFAEAPRGQKQKGTEKDLFDVWFFTGHVKSELLETCGCEVPSGLHLIPAALTLVNDRIIKASISHLDSGEFPYDVMTWQRRDGTWAGKGVARQMRTCQRGLNAAARNLMDNAGLSGGPQVVVHRGAIVPADGNWTLTPRKLWYTADDADSVNVREAFMVFNIQCLQRELMDIIMWFLKMAEDVTGLPMLIQGQQGKAPDTVGGMTMLFNNANSVLRRIARLFDDRVTVPHVTRYYEYLLIYGQDDEEKGDFQIKARGSSALVERDQQKQGLLQMANIAVNPAFGIDPEKWANEVLKSQRFDPSRFEMDDEKKRQIAKMAQQPQDKGVAVAQIREQGAAQRQQADQAFEAQQRDQDRQLDILLKKMDAAIAQAEQEGHQAMSVEDIKAMLASTAMKLRTQRDLAGSRQVLAPPSEPPQRAPNGTAFWQ